jgi:hypothetical protein
VHGITAVVFTAITCSHSSSDSSCVGLFTPSTPVLLTRTSGPEPLGDGRGNVLLPGHVAREKRGSRSGGGVLAGYPFSAPFVAVQHGDRSAPPDMRFAKARRGRSRRRL